MVDMNQGRPEPSPKTLNPTKCWLYLGYVLLVGPVIVDAEIYYSDIKTELWRQLISMASHGKLTAWNNFNFWT